MEKRLSLAAVFVLASFALAVAFYPALPDSMASHWNATGQVDGWMPKPLVVLLAPVLSAAFSLLMFYIPRADPLKANVARFQKQYYGFIAVFAGFLFWLQTVTISWGLGITFNMTQALAPAFGVMFYYIGSMLEKTGRNWFIGIRTPWTMSSDIIWKKTHVLGAHLFRVCGLACFGGMVFPSMAIFLVLAPAILSAAYVFLYSYLEYRKENKSVVGRVRRKLGK